MQVPAAVITRGRLLAICATAVLALAPDIASAQEIPAAGGEQRGSRASDAIAADSVVRSSAPLPFARWVITPDSIDRAPLTSMSDLLHARVPGLSAQRISGASGSASRLRMRGTRSTLASSTPLIIVDGLRVATAAPSWPTIFGFDLLPDDEWASRLDDLDPEDVERVEVLGGPAAASRFGSGAAAGAILITTRQGADEGFHWAAHSTFGTVTQITGFPSNYDQRGIDAGSGEPVDYCGIIRQAQHACTALADSLLYSNALMLHSPFRTGTRSQLGVNGGAGSRVGSIYIATNFTRESGTVDVNDLRRNHVLGHGVIRPFPSLAVSARAGYTRGSLTGINPAEADIFYSGLRGGPDDPQGYSVAPDTVAMLAENRGAARFIDGGTVTWTPVEWLRFSATLGEDRNSWVADQNPPSFDPNVTISRRTSYTTRGKTARAEASSSWGIGRSFRVAPNFGWERLERKERGRYAIINSYFSSTAPAAYTSFSRDYRVNATFGQLELSWKDRVALTGGFRHAKTQHIDDAATYPTLGASWRISSEPWFPRNGFVNELTVRAAYGEARQSRVPLDSDPFVVPRDADASETELGIDMAALDHRLTLSLTHYHGRSDASQLGNPTSPFTPPPLYPESVLSRGLEIGLSAAVFEKGSVAVHLDATAAFPRTIYHGTPAFVGTRFYSAQRLTPDYPVAGYWDAPIIGYADANGDHMISTDGCIPGQFPSWPTCEVRLGEISYLGPASPTREFSFRPRVVRGSVTLSALFDYRGGNKLFNNTEWIRCSVELCRASQDSRAPLRDQARVAAAMLGSSAGYIEDGGYWKFRELSLAFAAPGEWAAALGARRLAITLAARNLATWTRYGGPDPEVSSSGYESFASLDSFSQPAARYLMLRLDIGW